MTEENQSTDADAGRLEHGVRPVAWTLQSELDARETTCKAHLWFSDPVNSAWAPLYDQAAIDAAVGAERERCAQIVAGKRFRDGQQDARRGPQGVGTWHESSPMGSVMRTLVRAIRGPNLNSPAETAE